MTVQEVFGVQLQTQVSALSDKDSQAPTPAPKVLKSQETNDTEKTGKMSVTFGAQQDLPPLPIPSLDETLNKFLASLEALQDEPEQRDEAQRIVLEFLKGDGPKLQELLLEYDRKGCETGAIGSYVKEFWNDS
jgi:carnitine O-acetyltransferase